MLPKPKFVPGLHEENRLIDVSFLTDLTTHSNELNMYLQGEN